MSRFLLFHRRVAYSHGLLTFPNKLSTAQTVRFLSSSSDPKSPESKDPSEKAKSDTAKEKDPFGWNDRLQEKINSSIDDLFAGGLDRVNEKMRSSVLGWRDRTQEKIRSEVNNTIVSAFEATGSLGRYVVDALGRLGIRVPIPGRDPKSPEPNASSTEASGSSSTEASGASSTDLGGLIEAVKSRLPSVKDTIRWNDRVHEISSNAFPDRRVKELRRGTGGRSSFNGLIVTVFGATGSLGRSVVNALGRIGTQVIVPYRGDPFFARSRKLAGDLGQVLFVPFHLRDEESIARAMRHSNVVINLIGRDNPTPNFSYKDVHVTGAARIARIARESGIKRLIHVSALNSNPKPTPVYIRGGSGFLKSKYDGELAVRKEFPEVTILRPSDMYGVQDNYIWYYCMFYRRGYRKFPLANGGYGITKMPVAVSNVAQGIVNAVSDEDSIGKTYDAVGPRRYELRMLMEYLNEVIDKTRWNGGFKITNLDWDPTFRARISYMSFLNKLWLRKPQVTWEKIERETVTDEKAKNPTLTDLGVKLTYIEETWPHLLIIWRFDFNYEGDPGEKKLFHNPPFIGTV